MKRTGFFIIVSLASLSGLCTLFSPAPTMALPVVGFQAGRIIDDAIFTAKGTMSVTQIQNFLNSKVPVCDTYGTQPSEYGGGTRAQWGQANYGQSTFICLKDYSEGGKSAAQIIYDKAHAYSINPQVLIVLLQKEQGLVTDTWPLNIQYRAATGYGCPDTAPCDSQYYGLTNQLDWSAKMFRAIMDASPSWYTPYKLGKNEIRWSPEPSCGKSGVEILNRATQALYNYTPYQPNQAALGAGYGMGDSCSSYGNRNFYLYFSDWFGSTIIGQKLPVLYKSEAASELYAVWAGVKYYIPTYDMLVAWGLHRLPVTSVTNSMIASLSDGPNLSNIVKRSDDSSSPLFLLDDGKMYQVPISACAYNIDNTPNAPTTWGIDCFNESVTKSFPKALLENLLVQDIGLPEMIAYRDSVWKMEAGKKRRIVDGLVVDVLGGWGKVRWMKDLNAQQSEGKLLARNGYPVKFSDSPIVYIYSSDKLIPVYSYETFINWNIHKYLNFLPSSFNNLDPLPLASELTPIATDGTSYYIVDKGYKMEVAGDAVSQWPIGSAPLVPGILDRLQSIPLSNVYLSEASGQIFTVFAKKRYVFPSMDDFFRLGFKTNTVRRVTGSVENIAGLEYGGMHLANSRLYKINNNPHQIYIVNNSNSLLVNSINYPGLDYGKLITVDPTTASRYPTSGIYALTTLE